LPRIGTPGFFDEATGRIDAIHRELKTQSEYLRTISTTDVQTEAETFRWIKASGTADATGALTLPLENTMGYALELVSWSAQCGSASNGVLLIYLSGAEPQNLIWSTPMTQYNSDKFTSGMIVPINGKLVAVFGTIGNAQLCFFNVLTRRVQIGQGSPYRSQLQGW